jgi:hypothetical protein
MSKSPVSSDKLRIPIEIKTDDLEELQEIIKGISDAESDLRALPQKGKKGGGVSRSAIQQDRERPFTGGIFEQTRGTPSLPLGKDRTSRQATQRENEFTKLRDKVDKVEESTGKFGGQLAGMAANLGFAGVATVAGRNAQNISRGIGTKAAIVGTSTASGAVGLAKGGVGGLTGIFAGIAGKAFLPIAIVTTMITLITTITNEMFRDGGVLDRRFRRKINSEVASATDRKEKAEIQQGLRVLRITPVAGFRGEGATVFAQQNKNLETQYLQGIEMGSKGGWST